jgi:hypothetical protein
MIVMLVLALVTPMPEPVEAGRLKRVLAPQGVGFKDSGG